MTKLIYRTHPEAVKHAMKAQCNRPHHFRMKLIILQCGIVCID